jgi:hypothetical protein
MSNPIHHLDNRERLLARIDTLRAQVDAGFIVGIAYVVRTADGDFQQHCGALPAPANYDRTGRFIGEDQLRAGLGYLTTFIDSEKLAAGVDPGPSGLPSGEDDAG